LSIEPGRAVDRSWPRAGAPAAGIDATLLSSTSGSGRPVWSDQYRALAVTGRPGADASWLSMYRSLSQILGPWPGGTGAPQRGRRWHRRRGGCSTL